MFNIELISERKARESRERRQNRDAERRERICDEKFRTIGVDKVGLDLQLEEKKMLEEAAKREEAAYNADMQLNLKTACLIEKRQEKEKREAEKARVAFLQQRQHPRTRREFDLNDPDGLKKADGQMLLPGLVGEDPENDSRHQRQKEQLRDWLIRQQDEQQQERQQQKMDELYYNQTKAAMDQTAQELQNLDTAKRKADLIETTNYNLAKAVEKRNQEKERRNECSAVSIPGIYPGANCRAPVETLQQVVHFRRSQVEEKKMMELEKKQEEESHDRIQLRASRSALLLERYRQRLDRQLRKDMDMINAQLAQTHLLQSGDLKRGHIDDSFFSKFNTCGR